MLAQGVTVGLKSFPGDHVPWLEERGTGHGDSGEDLNGIGEELRRKRTLKLPKNGGEGVIPFRSEGSVRSSSKPGKPTDRTGSDPVNRK